MKALLRTAAFATLAITVISLYLLSPAAMKSDTKATPTDELEYPVLLVSGLGEGPGEAAFGKLEEYLEKYYFDVEVMDFDKYRKQTKLVNSKNQDYLGVMAAVLGMEIQSVLKQYNTEKLHIVAHSFGGLIVQAYLLNYGEEFSKKQGFYDHNVARVCYIQTPFYGSTADPDVIKDLVNDTDYGAFTNTTAITSILEPGSSLLFDMDERLRANNIYRYRDDWDFIDAATFVSRADEIVDVPFGLLSAFMRKGETTTFNNYSVFDGKYGKYSHSTDPSSAVDNMNSLAYVEHLDDPNFMAIASFLDNGRNWRKIGFKNLTDEGIVMVQYQKKPGFKGVDPSDVTLLLKKKWQGSISADAPARADITASYLNETTQTFVFSGLASGTYMLKIKNPKQQTLEEEIEIDPVNINSYSYDPKEHKLYEGGDKYSPKGTALFAMDELVFSKGKNQEELWAPLPGLNTNGFAIEFDCSNGDNNYDKGVIFAFYNADGRQDDWRWNGGRLEFNYRSIKRNGVITIYLVADVDHDGAYHREAGEYEISEEKSEAGFDWEDEHHVKVAQYTLDGKAHVEAWVDYELVLTITEIAPYYNPDPIISFGGRYHTESYLNPEEMILKNIVIYNLQ
jgi:pimeloyl-ACP methyl ester carboxylesterase